MKVSEGSCSHSGEDHVYVLCSLLIAGCFVLGGGVHWHEDAVWCIIHICWFSAQNGLDDRLVDVNLGRESSVSISGEFDVRIAILIDQSIKRNW